MHRLDITGRLQARLLEIIGAALPLITASMGDADLTGLAHLREEMIHAMEAYRRHVDQLHAAALCGGNRHRLAAAQNLLAGCSSIRTAYECFRDRWAHRHAVENWHEYRLSAIVMMKQVRDHVLRSGHRSTA